MEMTKKDKDLLYVPEIVNRYEPEDVIDCYKETKKRKRGFGYFLSMVADVRWDGDGYQGFDVDDLEDDEITVLFDYYKQKQVEGE